jgi:hypothetical protein
MNNEDQQLIDCAQTLREATKGKTDVTVSRRATFSPHSGKISTDYNIYLGDLLGSGPWRWECSTGATLQQAFEDALTKITAQGDERARDLAKLKDSAAKLGVQLVEVQP